jgi:hypothetical protein
MAYLFGILEISGSGGEISEGVLGESSEEISKEIPGRDHGGGLGGALEDAEASSTRRRGAT